MRLSPCLLLVLSSLPYLVHGASNSSFTWENCGNAHDAVQVKSVAIVPDPPIPGSDLEVKVVVDVLKRVEDGATGTLELTFEGVPILNDEFDVCKEATPTAKCPIDPGKYTIKRTLTLPPGIPMGAFTIVVDGSTDDGTELMCVGITGEIMTRGEILANL